MSRGDVTEAELLGWVLGAARRRGLQAFHSTDARLDVGPGFPDLVIAGPGGVIFAELKSATGETSAEQDLWLWTLRQSCQYQVVWRPRDWMGGAIADALNQLAAPHLYRREPGTDPV